jgi:hypothetical protein
MAVQLESSRLSNPNKENEGQQTTEEIIKSCMDYCRAILEAAGFVEGVEEMGVFAHPKVWEKLGKCEPDNLSYLSNPPQFKCKKCGKHLVAGNETPTCSTPAPSADGERCHQFVHAMERAPFVCNRSVPCPVHG